MIAVTTALLGMPSVTSAAYPLKITGVRTNDYPEIQVGFARGDKESSLPIFRVTEGGVDINAESFAAGPVGIPEDSPRPVNNPTKVERAAGDHNWPRLPR